MSSLIWSPFFHFACLSRSVLVSAVNVDMRSGCDWVLANINVTGYYRVNYDLANWERLLAQLDTQHQVHRNFEPVACSFLSLQLVLNRLHLLLFRCLSYPIFCRLYHCSTEPNLWMMLSTWPGRSLLGI